MCTNWPSNRIVRSYATSSRDDLEFEQRKCLTYAYARPSSERKIRLGGVAPVEPEFVWRFPLAKMEATLSS
ncbi:hypothetical protein C5748_25535 [Phyllobacterium phragmitis]|uniref:Uncharacterized protein n=1 Tax=Phyllobacterium phragmitis TaxID=2670329 RepID=A0A2S9IJI4_9HYPH|nr:hypothetical protein C5748_25535 [Phyllobacterium phragmitis]